MGVDCWYCSRYGEGSSSVTEPPSSDDLLLPLRASPSTVARMPPAPGRGAVCSESAWYCRGEISRSFFVVLLLCTGRCYKAEICVILLFLIGTFRCNHFFAEVKIFIFRPKTMDYNKAFLPKSRRFSAVLLLHSGRCYEAEIYAILFLLRCPFIRYHFFGRNQIFQILAKNHGLRFYRNRGDFLWSFYSTVEGAVKLKFAPFCSS